MRAVARGIGLAKAIEHERQHVGCDALAGVGDDDLDTGVDTLDAHLHPAAGRRELHRVQHEIPHDLLQPIRIATDGARARADHALDPDFLGLRRGPRRVERLLDDALEVDRADVETHLARDHARHVEQVVDELHLRVGLADDDVQRAGHALAADLAALQHPRPAIDGVERGAELVREDGEEFVLRAIGLRRLSRALLHQGRGVREGAPHVLDLLHGARAGRHRHVLLPEGLGGGGQRHDRLRDATAHQQGEPEGDDRARQAAGADGEQRAAQRRLHGRLGDAEADAPAALRRPRPHRVDRRAFERARHLPPLGRRVDERGELGRDQTAEELLEVPCPRNDALAPVEDRTDPVRGHALPCEHVDDGLRLDDGREDVDHAIAVDDGYAHGNGVVAAEPTARDAADRRPPRGHDLLDTGRLGRGRQDRAPRPSCMDQLPAVRCEQDDVLPIPLRRQHAPDLAIECAEILLFEAAHGHQRFERGDRAAQRFVDRGHERARELDGGAFGVRALIAVEHHDGERREGDHRQQDGQDQGDEVRAQSHRQLSCHRAGSVRAVAGWADSAGRRALDAQMVAIASRGTGGAAGRRTTKLLP